MSNLTRLLDKHQVDRVDLANVLLGDLKKPLESLAKYERDDQFPKNRRSKLALYLSISQDELVSELEYLPVFSNQLRATYHELVESLANEDLLGQLPRPLQAKLPAAPSPSSIANILMEDFLEKGTRGAAHLEFFKSCCELVTDEKQIEELLIPFMTASASCLIEVKLDKQGCPIANNDETVRVSLTTLSSEQEHSQLLGLSLRIRQHLYKDRSVERMSVDIERLSDKEIPYNRDFDIVIPPCRSADLEEAFEQFEEQLAHKLGFRPAPLDGSKEDCDKYRMDLEDFVSTELDESEAQAELSARIYSLEQPLAFGMELCNALQERIRERYPTLQFVLCSQSSGEVHLRANVSLRYVKVFLNHQVEPLHKAKNRLARAEQIKTALETSVTDDANGEDAQIKSKVLDLVKKPTDLNLKKAKQICDDTQKLLISAGKTVDASKGFWEIISKLFGGD